MVKSIGYIIFAIIYYIGCIFHVDNNLFFCVMTHDGSDDSSVGVVIKAIKERKPDARFVCVRKSDRGGAGLFDLVFKKSAALARAGTVLMDNEFLPLAYVKIRKGVKVVQLWHGTGTIKKFGHDANSGRLLGLEKKADSRITHLIVNSEYTAGLYQGAFGVTEDKVYLTGIPRTDVMFNDDFREKAVRDFYERSPGLVNKRLILYAPTFRDEQVTSPRVELNMEKWCSHMDEDTVLLLRLHPHVADAYDDTSILQYGDKVQNVSGYSDLNTLLFVADALITDYSSIIFEYALLDRPMYFYAYDIDVFSEYGRGFYEDYNSFVPGPVAETTEGLISLVKSGDGYSAIRGQFKDKFYRYLDGKSTKRLLDILLRY